MTPATSLTRRVAANLAAAVVFGAMLLAAWAVAYVVWHLFPPVFDWLYSYNDPDSSILNGDT